MRRDDGVATARGALVTEDGEARVIHQKLDATKSLPEAHGDTANTTSERTKSLYLDGVWLSRLDCNTVGGTRRSGSMTRGDKRAWTGGPGYGYTGRHGI